MPKKKYRVTLGETERAALAQLLHSGQHATREGTSQAAESCSTPMTSTGRDARAVGAAAGTERPPES